MEPDDYDPLAYLEKLDRYLAGEEQTTLYFELEKLGCPPRLDHEMMSDEEVSRALTELIWGIYDLNVVIDFADHMNDRELYLWLLEYCDEPTVCFADNPYAWCHAMPDCENWDVYLRYYADDLDREREAAEGKPVPPKELPPYYRSWLPWRDGLHA